MIPQTSIDLLQAQLTHELTNQNLYEQMSKSFENVALYGMASWMHKQAQEEHSHFDRIAKYLSDNRVEAIVAAIPEASNAPLARDGAATLFQFALARERETTTAINAIYFAAKDTDPWTFVFILDFVKEQIEEEAQLTDILDRFPLDTVAWMDAELGKR